MNGMNSNLCSSYYIYIHTRVHLKKIKQSKEKTIINKTCLYNAFKKISIKKNLNNWAWKLKRCPISVNNHISLYIVDNENRMSFWNSVVNVTSKLKKKTKCYQCRFEQFSNSVPVKLSSLASAFVKPKGRRLNW